MARLILDTAVLIAAERDLSQLDRLVADQDDAAIAAVTAAELLVGVELADRDRRAARSELVEDTLAVLPIEDYDLAVARAHARLIAEQRRLGKPRGTYDTIIAATAVATDRTVLTFDAGFTEMSGVDVRLLTRPRRER